LRTHQSGERMKQAAQKGTALTKKDKESIEKITKPAIEKEILRKYIAFARQKCFPILSQEAIDLITEFYVGLRDQGRNEGKYAATARQLEGLVRLSEASAKVRLSDVVERVDAERAVGLVRKSLEDSVTDPETGKIDIDLVTSGTSQAKHNAIMTVLKIVKEEMAKGVDMVPIEQVIASGIESGLDETKIMGALDELERKGDLYKPRHHFVKPTNKNRQ